MVAIGLGEPLCLLHEEMVDVLSVAQFHAVVRPAGTLRLDVESGEVSSEESRFGRTVRVEPHVVKSVAFACLEHVGPGLHVHGSIAGDGEVAVLNRSTKLCLLSVDIEHPSSDFEFSHAEYRLKGVVAFHEAKKLIGEEIDFSDTPDLLPIVAAAAAASPGKTTRLTGAARLRIKESDRLSAMADAIRCLGGEAEELPDGLTVRGRKLAGGTVDGRHDHRIVMSAAVAATVCAGPVTVLGAEAVNKSYPGFWRDFAALGGKVHV